MPPGQWCNCCFCQTLEVETNNHRQPPRGRGGDAGGGSGNSGMGTGGEIEIVAGKADFESRYEFVKTLGDGGQGGVYKYRRRADGAMVAVKEFGCLTAKEWRILSSVRHPHICGLVDRTRYENPRVRCTKLVMEIMDTSLQAYMMRGAKRDKLDPELDHFDVETARELILPLALALDYLHHKLVVHLDVKLDNIMLRLQKPEAGSGPQGRERAVLRDPETGRLVVKLADFGLAMLLGGDPCDEHSGSGSYYCLGGGGGASGGNNNNEMDDGVAMMGGNEAAAAAAATGGRRWGQQGQGDGGGGNGQTEQLRQSLVGKDSPPTSPGGQRERRFPAVGTMAYMAPEVEHDSRFGVQADIFSLGVVLHVLLTGRFPQTGLNQPARIHTSIPDVDGLRGLLASMLHGDQYQRPHAFEVLDHPFLRPLRRPGDTLLGDLDDEAEHGGRVMLLQIRRGVQQGAPAPTTGNSGSGLPPLSPQLLAVQSEERPLEVYVAYMDLAEIDDRRSTVVVCGRKEGMRRVKKGEASTLGAILVRERAGSATELGEILDLAADAKGGGQEGGVMEVDGGDEGMREEKPSQREQQRQQRGGSPGAGNVAEEGWPSVQRLVRKSGQPFEYVRALYAALSPDGPPLGREAIWAIYQELRCMGPELAAEAGTALYLPMTGCNDRVEGFGSLRAQRHAVIQESISLAAHLAEAVPSRRLESIVLYTWQKDSMHALMDFVRAHREDCHGMMAARLDDRTYRAYVTVLQAAAAAAAPGLFAPEGPGWLAAMLKGMEALDAYPAVCVACHAVGARLLAGPLRRVEGAGARARGVVEVLDYNREKVAWEERERGRRGDGGWVDMVGHYDTVRSLHALLSLLRALDGKGPAGAAAAAEVDVEVS